MSFIDRLLGRTGGSTLAAFKRDHQDPERRWVHAFLAFYTGKDGDPRHTLDAKRNIDHLQKNWGTEGAAELVKLMDGYENRGKSTAAFDLIRVIKLARHGAGAGWLKEEDSWARCFRCAQRLRQHFPRWEDVYTDFQAGREAWWTGNGKPVPPEEVKWYAQRYAEGNHLIFSKLPLRP